MRMVAVTGCAEPGPEAVPVPVHRGSATALPGGDPVKVRADAATAGGADAARDRPDRFAAGDALSRGGAFARQVSTAVSEQGGVWRTDEVYSISPTLRAGHRTIDAKTTMAACGENGIPTV